MSLSLLGVMVANCDRFHAFFNQIDQFRSNHFLWVTAGGLDAASLTGQNKEQEEVDRQLGDEDEDPEGGDG